ncbi:MAG: DUF971 domain-containing protein [Gammaproteobacteria bacterium]|nr:DUF971 domain-containing protein [Gammaproteobacteria bacterium]
MSIHITEIKLNKKARTLDLTFGNGEKFTLTSEYLRINSPSAEVQGHGPGQGTLQIGKADVAIDKIDSVGNYAIQLHFDDNHNTGIYSWTTLYDLASNHDKYWAEYLQQLKEAGHKIPNDA